MPFFLKFNSLRRHLETCARVVRDLPAKLAIIRKNPSLTGKIADTRVSIVLTTARNYLLRESPNAYFADFVTRLFDNTPTVSQ